MDSRKNATLPLALVALGVTVAASVVCVNPLWAIISGCFFLGLQFLFGSEGSGDYGVFFMNIQEKKVQNAVGISLLTSITSFIVYVVMTYDGTCYTTTQPLYHTVPLKIIFTLSLLWRVIIPDNNVTPSRAVMLMVLFVFTSACWVVAASSFEYNSQWLWWPAIHSVVVDTGIYSVLLVHYASRSSINDDNSLGV